MSFPASDPASRVLLFGGIVLLLVNMFLGEVFAIFISHVANGEIRERWVDVVIAARAADFDALSAHFSRIESLLDWRGRIMNTHSHVGAFGMLALLLVLIQPLLGLGARLRMHVAAALVAGGFIQTLFVFASHFTGSWAFQVSDLGAALVIMALGATLVALWRTPDGSMAVDLRVLLADPAARFLVRGGGLLVLLGMLGGLAYAAVFTFLHEPALFRALEALLAAVQDPDLADPRPLVMDYRGLNSRMAITTAAHSHAIEMGILAMLLAPAQAALYYAAPVKRAWAVLLLAGAYLLPMCIFLATRYGLKAAAFADISGLLVIVALSAMLVGLIRRTGVDDREASP